MAASGASADREDDAMHESAQELAATVQFEANQLLIMCLLLVLALLLGRVLHRHHVSSLTESGLFIAVGVLFGGLMYILVENGAAGREAMQHFFFNHELFNLILLPHIIFEAGYSLPRDLFFTRIGAILTFAVVGTVIATLFTWLLIVIFSQTGLVLRLSVIEAGALAALISAIDPVSTLTLFKLLKVHPDLHNILFGESVLNDAVSIIIFRSIQRFFKATFRPVQDTLLSAVAFAEVASGSIGIGLLVAFCAAGVLRLSRLGHTSDSAIVEAGVFWIFSYGSFLVAEAVDLSGIVSALFCGIAMQRYAVPNLSAEARVAVPLLLQTIASLAETTVFVLVGLATWVYMDKANVWTLTLVTMVGCFGGRALNIFGLARFLNVRAKPEYRIPFAHQLVMWFSGLRGAIAVTLAVQVPGAHHDEIVMVTVVIVLFTTFVLGGLSEPLIARVNIERGPEVIASFHDERKRRKREAREAFEDGSDFLIYATRASEASAQAYSASRMPGLQRIGARLRHTFNLCRDPRASMSLFAAAAYLDRHYLKPLLVDSTVNEAIGANAAAAGAGEHDGAHPTVGHGEAQAGGAQSARPPAHLAQVGASCAVTSPLVTALADSFKRATGDAANGHGAGADSAAGVELSDVAQATSVEAGAPTGGGGARRRASDVAPAGSDRLVVEPVLPTSGSLLPTSGSLSERLHVGGKSASFRFDNRFATDGDESSDDDDGDVRARRAGIGLLASYAQHRSSRLFADGDDAARVDMDDDSGTRAAPVGMRSALDEGTGGAHSPTAREGSPAISRTAHARPAHPTLDGDV